MVTSSRHTAFTPRDSSVTVLVEGVRVEKLRVESSQARRLARGIKQARVDFARAMGRPPTDEELVDSMIAALFHDFQHTRL